MKDSEKIRQNEILIAKLKRQNKQLLIDIIALPKEKRERYAKELSSDGWKHTEYYKKNFRT